MCPHHRSLNGARLNRVESLRALCLAACRASKAAHAHHKKRAIQTHDFQSAIRVARRLLCSRLLFRSPRATQHNKIRVFVNSFTGEGSPVEPAIKSRISGREVYPDMSRYAYQTRRIARRSVIESNPFGHPCKPLICNSLHVMPNGTVKLVKRPFLSTSAPVYHVKRVKRRGTLARDVYRSARQTPI